MFCPGCKQNVVGEKVFDWTVFGKSCLHGLILFVCVSLIGSPLAGLGIIPFVLICALMRAWLYAPLSCPNCRTRLVNPLGGDEPPAYRDKEQAYQSSRQGFCQACKAENVADSVYCSKCGQKLE